MQDTHILALVIGAILVNNFVLTRFLGICPFLGVSKQLGTALGMAGAVLFVMTMASAVTSAVNQYILVKDAPLLATDLSYLQTIVFILVIASLVQFVEIILQRFSPPLYRALGIYLPLITTNCAVLGAAVLSAKKSHTVLTSTIFGAASAVGFTLALVLFASLREKLELADVPKCMEGTAIALVTAGLLAMAFMGFAGLGA